VPNTASALRLIADGFSGIAFVADRSGQVEHLSPRFYEFTGISRSQPPGEAMRKAIHPNDRSRVVAQWEAAVEAAAPFRAVFRLRQGEGKAQWFWVFGRLIAGPDDERSHWLGVCLFLDDIGAIQLVAEDDREERPEQPQALEGVYEASSWIPITTSASAPASAPADAPGAELGEIREKLTAAATFATAAARLLESGAPAQLQKAREMLNQISVELVAVGRMIRLGWPGGERGAGKRSGMIG